jgi:hypothetical protein
VPVRATGTVCEPALTIRTARPSVRTVIVAARSAASKARRRASRPPISPNVGWMIGAAVTSAR